MRRKFSALALIFVLGATPVAFVSAGCASFKTNPAPADVQQARAVALKVTAGLKTTAVALRALQDLEISFHDAALVTDTEHGKIQTAFKAAFQSIDTALVAVGNATSLPSLKTTLGQVTPTLNSLADALSVAAPKASDTLKKTVATIQTALDVAIALIGG